jgi:hypothetical protein
MGDVGGEVAEAKDRTAQVLEASVNRFDSDDGHTRPAVQTAATALEGTPARRNRRSGYLVFVVSRSPDHSELVVLGDMVLAIVEAASARPLELMSLTIGSTYGGMLEGYPNTRMNDALLSRLGRRRGPEDGSIPAHVITPPRSRPERSQEPMMPFGPVETLPAVYCEGYFRSRPVARSSIRYSTSHG